MDNTTTTSSNPSEIFSYNEYKKLHTDRTPVTFKEKITHKIKHHKMSKPEYDQIYEECQKLNPDEPILWMGKSSQAIHVVAYAICLLFGFLIFPLFIALYIYIQTKHTIYVITSQRLRLYTGIFIKRIDDVELYRVKDTVFLQPFFLRWFGLSNIQLITSDATWGDSMIQGIPNGRMLREKLRNIVELARERKGVKEIDYYTRSGMPPQL